MDCNLCKRELGERTDQPLIVNELPVGLNGGLPSEYNPIFSKEFLDLFSLDEIRNIVFREVISRKKSKKLFFELIGPPITEEIGVKSFPGKKVKLSR